MNAKRVALLLTGCLAALASIGQEGELGESDRLFMHSVKSHCEWAKANAPAGNPVTISACDPGEKPSVELTEQEYNAWWAYWRDNDEPTFTRLNGSWDAERTKREAQYAAERAKIDAQQAAARKAAAQKKAKAERERLVASLPSMNTADLCAVVRRGKVPEALEELVKRKTFPDDETALIAGQKIRLGMSEGGMLCSLGPPKRSNRSVGSWGVHIQYVFDYANVYTENGKVTSWQD